MIIYLEKCTILKSINDNILATKMIEQERHQDVVRVSYTCGKTGKLVKQFLVIF